MPGKIRQKVAQKVAEFSHEKFEAIQQMTHTEQAIWFLNGFWEDGGIDTEAEQVWVFLHSFWALQYGKEKYYGAIGKKQQGEALAVEGSSLDQFQAQRFLEKHGETKTASALRKDLATIDVNNDNRMSLTEYLMFKYKKTPHQVITAPQGGNQKELKAAEEQVAETRALLDDLSEKHEAAQEAAALAADEAAAAAAALDVSNTAAAEAAESLEQATTAAQEATVLLRLLQLLRMRAMQLLLMLLPLFRLPRRPLLPRLLRQKLPQLPLTMRIPKPTKPRLLLLNRRRLKGWCRRLALKLRRRWIN
jgi:hypothetical protein